MIEIADNLQRIRSRIAAAAEASGRGPEEITLIAVSKNFLQESISSAITAGQTHFGENRVQEAESKIPYFQSAPNITWHMIGHLQSNKAWRAAELFDVIHSVDSIKLARKLSQAALELGKTLSVLIQVDLGHEETKFGADRGQVAEIVAATTEMGGLRLDGLMTMPPFFEDPERTRPYFAALRELRQSIEQEQPGALGHGQLSMGMSHDFEVAIQEGATIVRVGTAIFGERSND
jgi:pyridoxal phosphate enzyme (YggS family)